MDDDDLNESGDDDLNILHSSKSREKSIISNKYQMEKDKEVEAKLNGMCHTNLVFSYEFDI